MYAHYFFSKMEIFHNPVFRECILILAIVVLIIFCIDKSRQNQRTRQALYNCIYPLYGAAVLKTVMLTDSVMGFSLMSHTTGLAIVLLAMIAYWRFFPPKEDISFNSIFRYIGWIVLAIAAAMQTFFLVYTWRQ